MRVEHLFQPFEVRFVTGNECPVKQHRHSYFELVYILRGEGIHHINENRFSYYPDNLFLMKPGDMHHFSVAKETAFMLIGFNNIYLEAQKGTDEHNSLGDWTRKLEYIFHNSTTNGCIIRNAEDKPLARALITGLQHEHSREQTLRKELIQQLLNTLMTIVARNISLHHTAPANGNSTVSLDIIQYIHQNIYEQGKLKAETIAAHFHLSQNYISEYFKKHTMETLQQYILNYKIKLAEARLQYSDMRLGEIALELGFTDKSHLTNTFKKYKGVSPSQFRKELAS